MIRSRRSQPQTPAQAAQATQQVAPAAAPAKAQPLSDAPLIQSGHTVPAPRQPPAQAGVAATRATVRQATARLEQLAGGVGGEVGEKLAAAAAAARRTNAMASVGTPARYALTDDPSRPAELRGRVSRRWKGPADDKQLEVTFKPFGRDASPFPIPAEMVRGLADGGMGTLRLDRAASTSGAPVYGFEPDPLDLVPSLLGVVEQEGGQAFVRTLSPLAPYDRVPLQGEVPSELLGQAVVARLRQVGGGDAVAQIQERVGDPDGPSARMLAIALDAGAEMGFPPEVRAEIEAIKADPKIDGPDFTHIPFTTIDYETSKDLDQAMAIERRPGGGFTVHYAIADAAHFVKQGSAIDKIARRRATTTYLPDRSLPMLPRELSEDLCSLVEGEPRRAFIVTTHLDANGQIVGDSEFKRGVIKSQGKLNYNQVQRAHEQGFSGELGGQAFTESLQLLREVGELRISAARQRQVIVRGEGGSSLELKGPEELRFERRDRNEVELWNEQISLLANAEVGRFLTASGVRSLHRVHPPPDPAKVEAARDMLEAIGIPWREGESAADYIDRIPENDQRRSAAMRLITRINRAASYTIKPGGHDGLKLEHYDHFTAPMRRYVDITTHRVLAALVEGDQVPHQSGGDLSRASRAAQRAKRRDSAVGGDLEGYGLAKVLADRIGEPLSGVIVDVGPGGVEIELDDPPTAVRMATKDLNRALNKGAHQLTHGGAVLEGPAGRFQLGSSVVVTAVSADDRAGKVELLPLELAQQLEASQAG